MHPEFARRKSNATRYGVTVLREEPEEDRYVCDAEFVTTPPTPLQYVQWSRATYEWAIQEAGFRDFAWRPRRWRGKTCTLWGSVLARFP